VVADFEGLGIHPALGVVGIEDQEAGDGGLELHLGDAGLGEIDIGLSLIAQAGEGGDFGAIGGSVKIDGGLLDLEFLAGDAVIDLAGLALEAADDLLFGGFEAGGVDGEVGVGEIGLVLFAGYFGLGEGLLEGGLGLAQGCLFLHEGFLSAGGIELNYGVALLDGGTGRGHPGDAEVGDHGRRDLHGALCFEFTAAADEDEEITLAGGGGGEDGGAWLRPYTASAASCRTCAGGRLRVWLPKRKPRRSRRSRRELPARRSGRRRSWIRRAVSLRRNRRGRSEPRKRRR